MTGISRYHEMGYVIELLIEHDQFESLVNKGVEKVCHLFLCKVCIALFDSLGRTVESSIGGVSPEAWW